LEVAHYYFMFFTIMMRDKNAHNKGQMMHDTLVNDHHMMQY